MIHTINEELIYLLAFKKLENVGDKTIETLYKKYKSLKRAWYADESEIKESNFKKNIEFSLEKKKSTNINDIENELEEILSQGIKIGDKFTGENYPRKLHELRDAPSVIYVKGTMKNEDEHAIAIVGTRGPSSAGKDAARSFSKRLAETGYTIISGLALGIDTEAHQGALEAGGRTIAVLGTGFNRKVLYPKENYDLFNTIAENGFCISEFPPNAEGLKYKMYVRNRIISILSKGVLIIETKNSSHSGTLAQARYALNQGRKVFVPEEIDAVSGNNTGWQTFKREVNPFVVSDYEDILEEVEKSATRQTDLLGYVTE